MIPYSQTKENSSWSCCDCHGTILCQSMNFRATHDQLIRSMSRYYGHFMASIMWTPFWTTFEMPDNFLNWFRAEDKKIQSGKVHMLENREPWAIFSNDSLTLVHTYLPTWWDQRLKHGYPWVSKIIQKRTKDETYILRRDF